MSWGDEKIARRASRRNLISVVACKHNQIGPSQTLGNRLKAAISSAY
jgi:hypothetical protein